MGMGVQGFKKKIKEKEKKNKKMRDVGSIRLKFPCEGEKE